MLGGGEAITRRGTREAEAGIVDGDAAKTVRQSFDDLPVQERPGRVPVQEQKRRSAPLVDVVEPGALDLGKAALERVERFRNPRWLGWLFGSGIRCGHRCASLRDGAGCS